MALVAGATVAAAVVALEDEGLAAVNREGGGTTEMINPVTSAYMSSL